MITFKDIETYGNILIENDRYIHYQTLDKLLQYDTNKITYKKLPDLTTFKKDEEYLKKIHSNHNQDFLKFEFPENTKIDDVLKEYLKKQIKITKQSSNTTLTRT